MRSLDTAWVDCRVWSVSECLQVPTCSSPPRIPGSGTAGLWLFQPMLAGSAGGSPGWPSAVGCEISPWPRPWVGRVARQLLYEKDFLDFQKQNQPILCIFILFYFILIYLFLAIPRGKGLNR